MTDTEIVKLIRIGDHPKALDCLYQNFPAFRNSLKKSGGNNADAEDIFQEALLILIQKISDEQFSLTCSLNSFLFGICRNLTLEYFRRKGKTVAIQLETDDGLKPENLDDYLEEERKYQALDKVLTRIGKKCMDILSMFYYKSMSMTSIAVKMGFKSETSAKTQKYKCIEKARNMAKRVLKETKTELS